MAARNYGLYLGPNGEMLITFEAGIKDVPVESLIPPAHRGERFEWVYTLKTWILAKHGRDRTLCPIAPMS